MMLKNSLRILGAFALILHAAFILFPFEFSSGDLGNRADAGAAASPPKEVLERRYLETIGELVERGELTQALDYLATKDLAPEKAAQIRERIGQQLYRQHIREIDRLVSSGDLAGAQQRIDRLLGYLPTDGNVLRRKRAVAEFFSQRQTAVPYEGDVRHIMFHSLIVYPELAFDGEYTETGYNNWMVTVDEFKAILDELYSRGYMLIDIHDLLEIAENGQIREKALYLPPGKKPIVLSVDDVSYYSYMAGDGFASRLDIHEETLDVINIVRSPEGDEFESYEGDVFPIVDSFVWEHPDFSYQGAKGILALTGYEGVLGYRTNELTSASYPEMAKKARGIADRMKELGWSFASHSYSHALPFRDASISFRDFKEDIRQWQAEVAPIIGETDVYISPFGYRLPDQDQRYRYLIEDEGFKIFCPVSIESHLEYRADNMVMDRLDIDGYSMRMNPAALTDFFDIDKVYDRVHRPAG